MSAGIWRPECVESPRESAPRCSHQLGARFGSKVIAVNTGLKVAFIAVALAVLLAPL